MCDVPGFSRFGLGAVTYGGVTVLNGEPLAELRITEDALDPVRERALAGLERSERWTPKATHRPKSPRTVVIVDDGVETSAALRRAAVALTVRTGPCTGFDP